MRQVCNDEYWAGMPEMKPDDAPCGRTFDDFDQRTFCPHPEFTGPTLGEIRAVQQQSAAGAAAEHARRFPK
jgi:hypothetical protein